MMLTTYRIAVAAISYHKEINPNRTSIGDAVTHKLNELGMQNIRVVAVVPRMLFNYDICPDRYEVVEVDLIVETFQPVTGVDPRD